MHSVPHPEFAWKGFPMPWCKLPRFELFFHDKGQGAPLVFLNGLSGDHTYWMGQVRFFSKHFRCLALDQRDVGQTVPPDTPYTPGDLARDVIGVLDQLGLPAAHIVGLSMG